MASLLSLFCGTFLQRVFEQSEYTRLKDVDVNKITLADSV